MRGLGLVAGVAAGLVLWGRPAAGAVPPDSAAAAADDALVAALRLVKSQSHAAALPLLRQALAAAPADPELQLLLGICYYRTGELGPAETHLLAAAGAADTEVSASARLFLGLLYRELGALDRAQVETDRATRGLGIEAQPAAYGARRFSGSVTVALEYDGNVPLTDLQTWHSDAQPSMDGNALVIASLRLRPLRRIGWQIGDMFTYRPQFLLTQYSLLHNGLWLGYRYLGATNQVQLTATLGAAALGAQAFFIDGEGRLGYRRRLATKLPLTGGLLYIGRYRNYFADDFRPLTGHTHQLQLELNFGSGSGPLLVSFGYEGIREQLREPEAADDPSVDYRAWAHGPWLHLRARPHKRLALELWGLVLLRRFDALPALQVRREDQFFTADLSLTVTAKSWLELFVGGAVTYNGSTDSSFSYLKPLLYLGATFSFSAG